MNKAVKCLIVFHFQVQTIGANKTSVYELRSKNSNKFHDSQKETLSVARQVVFYQYRFQGKMQPLLRVKASHK